ATAGRAGSRPAARTATRVKPRPPTAAGQAAEWRESETPAPVVRRSAQHPWAHGPAQPEDQQDDQHQAEQSATVMRTAPVGASPVVVAPASAEEQDEH